MTAMHPLTISAQVASVGATQLVGGVGVGVGVVVVGVGVVVVGVDDQSLRLL